MSSLRVSWHVRRITKKMHFFEKNIRYTRDYPEFVVPGTGVALKSRPPCESLPDPTGVRAREGRGGGGGEGEEGCEVRRVLLQIYIQIYSTNLQIVLHIVSCQLTHFVYMYRRQSAHTTRCMGQHAPASALYGALSRCALYVCIVCVPYMCALSVHLIWVSLMLRRTTSTLSVCTKK